MTALFGPLRYLYMGSGDFERDLAYYRDVLGAPLVWNLEGFGARVAAFEVGAGSRVLVADHRPPATCIPLFVVDDLERTASRLRRHGWAPEGEPFEIPDGPCYTFRDPSGNRYGIFQSVRPDALGADSHPSNPPPPAPG